MNIKRIKGNNKGIALIAALICLMVILIGLSTMGYMHANKLRIVNATIEKQQAFYLCEGGLQKAMAMIKYGDYLDEEDAPLPMPYNTSILPSETGITPETELETVPIAIQIYDMNTGTQTVSDLYMADALGKVNLQPCEYLIGATVGPYGSSKITRSLAAIVAKEPIHYCFDYAIFKNSKILDKETYAINGGAQSNYNLRTSGNKALKMPYLDDFFEDVAGYEALATGTVTIAGTPKISGVYNGSIILKGTDLNPIAIDGPVVVKGDLVITGVVNGKGSIYAQRNIYIPNNLTYLSSLNTPAPLQGSYQRETGYWSTPIYDNAKWRYDLTNWALTEKDKPLLGLFAKENIIIGNYKADVKIDTQKFSWDAYWTNVITGYGDEDVGNDRVPNTGDATEGDGTSDYDVDQDAYADRDYVVLLADEIDSDHEAAMELEENFDRTCLEFNGVDDYVEVADSDSLDLVERRLTITAWLYIDDFNDEVLTPHYLFFPSGIVEKPNDDSSNWASPYSYAFGFVHDPSLTNPTKTTLYLSLLLTRGGVTWPVDLGIKVMPSQTQLPIGEWVHVAVTYQENTVKFYHNGVNVGTFPFPPIPYPGVWKIKTSDKPVYLGKANMPEKFYSKLDDVRIYNYALDLGEIKQVMRESENFTEQMYLAMNEEEGVTAYDSSGNENDGGIYGADWVIRLPNLLYPTQIDAVLYTEHYIAGFVSQGFTLNGCLVARDNFLVAKTGEIGGAKEILVSEATDELRMTINYDYRISDRLNTYLIGELMPTIEFPRREGVLMLKWWVVQ